MVIFHSHVKLREDNHVSPWKKTMGKLISDGLGTEGDLSDRPTDQWHPCTFGGWQRRSFGDRDFMGMVKNHDFWVNLITSSLRANPGKS